MALISVDELNEYTQNYEDAAYKTTLISAASEVVEGYLGYSVASAERSYQLISYATDAILLPVPNVTKVSGVLVDGETLDDGDYTLLRGRLFSQLCFTNSIPRGAKVVITYTAGYETVPDAIKLAALRIAALMLEEANGNIGVTGKTFADMSKQFISYTNYDKYLRPISGYRLGAL